MKVDPRSDSDLRRSAPRSGVEETTRSLLNDVITAHEVERRRIAGELRDETAQTLTSLLLGLKRVQEAQDLGQAKAAARTLRGLVSDALDGVQRMAEGLRPMMGTGHHQRF